MVLVLWMTLLDVRDRVRRDPERGDVPGWVLVTIMSAALVALLITVAGPKLSSLFTSSVDKVSSTSPNP